MRCTDCDSALPDNARFCPDCGKKQGNRCTGCGKELDPTHRFCPDCGQAATAADNDDAGVCFHISSMFLLFSGVRESKRAIMYNYVYRQSCENDCASIIS